MKKEPMRHRAALVAMLLGLGTGAALSCSTGGADETRPGSTVGHGGSGISGGSGSGAPNPTPGAPTGGASSEGPVIVEDPPTAGGTGSVPAACAEQSEPARLVQVDMLVMLDKSGSMWEMTTGANGRLTKWNAVNDALVAFFGDPQSAGLGVGIHYFPQPQAGPLLCTDSDDCAPGFGPCLFTCVLQNFMFCFDDEDCEDETGTTELNGPCMGRCSPDVVACDADSYATPDVPIANLPDNAQALIDSINAQQAAHATPTFYALSGATEYARAWAMAHPEHKVLVVFATDGLPVGCDLGSRSFTAIAEVAEEALLSTPSVETFVIGVFRDGAAAEAKPNLDLVAAAGGTEESFIISESADVTQQFLEALSEIRGGQLSCELQLPAPPTGQELDFEQVNVTIKTQAETQFIGYVPNLAACDPVTGGWHYDNDPAALVGGGPPPTKIVLCPQTCEIAKGLTEGELGISLGCRTVVR